MPGLKFRVLQATNVLHLRFEKHLFKFLQFGDLCNTSQAHVYEAQRLKVGKFFSDAFHLSVIGDTVIQYELIDLKNGAC